jgi:hypothetical protein
MKPTFLVVTTWRPSFIDVLTGIWQPGIYLSLVCLLPWLHLRDGVQ